MNLNTKNKRIRTKFIQFDENYNLYCYKCGKYKPINLFDCNSNNWYRANRDRRCKECKKLQYLKRRENCRGKKDLDRMLLERWNAAKNRAKNHNLEFTITIEDLKKVWINL